MEGIEKIKVFDFDTSSENKGYLIEIEDRHFEVNLFIVQLVKALQQYPSFDDVVEHFRGPGDKKYTKEELESIVEKFIAPILKSPNTKKKQPLLFRIELVGKQRIEKISGLFQLLFCKPVMLASIIMFLALEVLFFIFSSEQVNLSNLNIYIVAGVIGLMIFFSFIHELGHAAACRYFNVEHGEVGFGLYWTFPVFYTDVSNVWKLPKQQRIVVNLGGVYFQIILLLFVFGIYFLTYNNLVRYFLVAFNISMLVVLNPFFKFDGYWIVSDLLGVANLRQRSKELFSYLFSRLLNRKIQQKPYLLTIKKKEKIFMIIYSVIVNAFFAFYFFYLLPMFLHQFFTAFPEQVMHLVTLLSNGMAPGFNLVQSIFTQLLFFALIVFALSKIVIFPIIRLFQVKRGKNG